VSRYSRDPQLPQKSFRFFTPSTLQSSQISPEPSLACPFFSPTDRADDLAFPHPARLPLGAAWRGVCHSPGHQQTTLSNQELESCNLGYAKSCPRLPMQRTCDAVRFAISSDRGTRVTLHFVLETAHLPTAHGSLEYDRPSSMWIASHSEARVQKLAESFLQSYLARKNSLQSSV
jgi:hypothetical protein